MTPRSDHNLRAVFAARGFRRLLGVRLSGQFADGLFQAALAGSVVFNPERQVGAVAIAMTSALLIAPYSLIGPFVGVLLDRWSRRHIAVFTNLLRATLIPPVALMINVGYEGIGFVLVAFVVIGVNRFLLAGLSAAVPHVVDDQRLVTANSLSGTLGSVCFSAGLGAAAALLTLAVSAGDAGYAVLAAIAPVGYLGAAALAWRSFGVRELGPDHTDPGHARWGSAVATVARDLSGALSHLSGRRGAAYAIAAQSGFRILFGLLGLAMLLLYRNYFVTDDDVLASITGLVFVVAAASAGVLAAAVLTPPVARRIGGWRWVVLLLAGAAAAIGAFGLPLTETSLVVAVFCINIAAQGIKIVVDTSIQHECDDDYRGRVFAVNDTAFNLAYVGGMFVAALALPADGHSPTVVVLVAVCCAALAVWYAVVAGRWARRRGDDIAQPSPPPVPAYPQASGVAS